MSKSKGWIGVDLDGTLAVYNDWDNGSISLPIPLMVNRIKAWLAQGYEVRIFTARVGKIDTLLLSDTSGKTEQIRTEIQDWSEKYIGVRLPVTCEKDYEMLELWDDRCVQVDSNTGRVLSKRSLVD